MAEKAKSKRTKEPTKKEYCMIRDEMEDVLADNRANGSAASNIWQKAEGFNVNKKAAQTMIQLRRMTPAKRNDYLRAFERYLDFEDFDRSDLVDQAEAQTETDEKAERNLDGGVAGHA